MVYIITSVSLAILRGHRCKKVKKLKKTGTSKVALTACGAALNSAETSQNSSKTSQSSSTQPTGTSKQPRNLSECGAFSAEARNAEIDDSFTLLKAFTL